MRLESLEPRCMLSVTGDLFYLAASTGLQLVATAPSQSTVDCGTERETNQLRDIAVDSSGQIYGVADRTDGSTNSVVYTVDSVTGALTWYQAITGYKNVNSLDFAGSSLYALDDDGALLLLDGSSYSKIATLNESSGDLAYQASTGRFYYVDKSNNLEYYYGGSSYVVGAIGSSYSDVFGLDFASDGTLYGVSNESTSNPQLIRISLTSGAGSLAQTYTGLGAVWGLAIESATLEVTPSATSGLTTTESGGTDTFTLTLASQPLANVTVALSTDDSTEGTVSPSSVVFTTSNWSTPQTVTVTGLSDSQTDGDVVYHVVTGSVVSGDSRYDGLAVSDIAVTNQDVDPPLVTFTATSRSVSEGDSSGMVDIIVSLVGAAQTSDVTVPFTVSGTATGDAVDYSITSSPITFSAGSTTETITVSLVDDLLKEDNETVVLNLQTPDGAGLGNKTTYTLTIVDNETTPTVKFSSASQSAQENAGTVVITAELSSLSGEDVTVPFTLGGTAIADTDYWITASPLTILAGESSASITVMLNADTLDEDNETVVVAMGTPTGATATSPASHTLTIIDDDNAPTVAFTLASQSPSEMAGTVTATVELSAASGRTVTVPFSVSGTATLDEDYTVGSSPITIPAGETTASVTIVLNDDVAYEYAESVALTLGTPTNATLGSPKTHTVMIQNEDPFPTVTFSTSEQLAGEGLGAMTVTMELSAPSALAVSVPFSVTGTATGGGADYSITSSPLLIAAGQTTGTIIITMIDDLVLEANETVILTMSTPANATLGSTTTHTASIGNNDAPPVVEFTSAWQQSYESVGTFILTAKLSMVCGLDVTLPFTTSGSAAGNYEDYSITESPIAIAAGETTATIIITVVNDVRYEYDEAVAVTLIAPVNATLGTTITHTAKILNDDAKPTVQFTASSQSYAEGGTFAITAELSVLSGVDVSVPFTVGGSAISGTDYTIDTSVFSIPAGQSTATITVLSVDDTLYENDETVTVALGTPSEADLGTTINHTITLLNNDSPPVVQFAASAESMAESVGMVAVTVSLSAASGLPVTLPFTVSGTATSAKDYAFIASPLIIAAGATSGTINVRLLPDQIDESDETVILTLGTPTDATLGATTVDTLTVINAPVASLTASSQSGAESGTMTVTVNLSAASSLPITLPFTLTGTAEANVDYTASPASAITIDAGETSGTVTFTVASESLYERNETIVLALTTPTNAFLNSTTTHTATILNDDDPPSVQFALAERTVCESDGTIAITVELSEVSGAPAVVPFTVTGTATSGTDYTLSSSPLTIPTGQTTGTISLVLTPDLIDESTETMTLTLGTPTDATLDSQTTFLATIINAPVVQFTTVSQSIEEGSSTITVTATISMASTLPITLPLTVSGTAQGGSDYSIDATQLTIPAGQTSASCTLTFLDDAIYEADETVIVTLDTPTNAVLGAKKTSTVTITNDDSPPMVTFANASANYWEYEGQVTVTVRLSAVSGLPVTIPFTVTGSATSGADYTITASPLTIPAGELTGSITITVVEDLLDENNETVVVTLGAPTDGVLGTTYTHTMTIGDNDAPPTVAFAAASQSAEESAGTMTVTLQLSAASGLPITVPFTITGTAANGTDYTITASPVTIAAGETTATITISLVDDGLLEPDETVIVTLGTPVNASAGTTVQHTATILGSGVLPTTIGLYDPASSFFYLRTSNTSGGADYTFGYGEAGGGWIVLVGDWNGDGVTGVGLYAPGTSTFYLTNAYTTGYADYTFGYGEAGGGWTPLVGDWDGDGQCGVGLYNPQTSTFYLTNTLQSGFAEYTFGYGEAGGGWMPLVGDWNGDTQTGVGLYNPHTSTFYLTNTLQSGFAEHTFGYGEPDAGWMPMVGDWDGDASDGVGLFATQTSTFYLTSAFVSGYAQYTFGYGEPNAGWTPMVGDWDGSGSAGVGLYDPSGSTFYLTNTLSSGYAEYTIGFGKPGGNWQPVVGYWGASSSTSVVAAEAVDQVDLASLVDETLNTTTELDTQLTTNASSLAANDIDWLMANGL